MAADGAGGCAAEAGCRAAELDVTAAPPLPSTALPALAGFSDCRCAGACCAVAGDDGSGCSRVVLSAGMSPALVRRRHLGGVCCGDVCCCCCRAGFCCSSATLCRLLMCASAAAGALSAGRCAGAAGAAASSHTRSPSAVSAVTGLAPA